MFSVVFVRALKGAAMKPTSLALWALPFAAAFVGCSSQPKPQPLTPEAFVGPRENVNQANDNPNTGGGAPGDNARPAVQLPGNEVANTVNRVLGQPILPNPPQPRDTSGARPNIPDVVTNEIKPFGAGSPGPNPAATSPLPAIGASSGQYMTLGGVVAEVNITPIYANKVLALAEKPLREKAHHLDINNYRRQAADDIQKWINFLIRDELEYAAAEKNLDADDRRLADAATIYWRIQKITKAGGSLELARRAQLVDPDQPMDFEERSNEQNRTELIRIYYNKKIYPRIQVSASDIREYYDRNVDKEFTENERVKFRLIKVDINKTSNGDDKKNAAALKIADKWKRAKAGEDFKAMATRENDEKMFAGEEPFDIAPKSFSIEAVRDALSKLNPGDISEILEVPPNRSIPDDKGAFYIVKLESRVGGRVQPFEEPGVQPRIKNKLQSIQFALLREQEMQKLYRSAIIRQEPQMTMIAVDMAMQRYAQYAAEK
jgi:hypothetical protein